jgi:hypothetical protein
MKMIDRMTKMATPSASGMKFLRNAVLSIVGHIHFPQYSLAEKISELDDETGFFSFKSRI